MVLPTFDDLEPIDELHSDSCDCVECIRQYQIDQQQEQEWLANLEGHDMDECMCEECNNRRVRRYENLQ